MSDLTRQLIRENIEKHQRGEDATVLDLGNCGIVEVPEEIGECIWVEELGLSSYWFDMDKVGQQKSKNSGQPNNITRLPNYATQLEKLKKIWV